MNRPTLARSVILLLTVALFSLSVWKNSQPAVHASAPLPPETQATRSDPTNLGAQASVTWKRYLSSEYSFEIAYPANWNFDTRYYDNYGRPPSGNRPAAYAGETRKLFSLEMDGPTQSQEGGGDFSDGAIVSVRITGVSATVEDWGIRPGQPWYLIKSTPSDFVKSASSWIGGSPAKVAVDTNGFTGVMALGCTGWNPCTSPWAEGGGAYRALPSGRVLLIDWDRMNGANGLSYQKYFLPMLASFKLRR